MTPDVALVVCRFLHDGSAMLLFGAFAYLSTLVPRPLALVTGDRLRSVQLVATAIAVATTVAALPLEAAVIGEGWSNAYDPAMIGSVLLETSVGQAWQAQAVAALLVAAALALSSNAGQIATALGAGVLLACLSLTGHAVMQAGWLGLAHRVNDTVHVLSGGVWLGALVPLLLILGALDEPERQSDAGVALRQFSTAGHVAVALVIASGSVNTALILGGWPADWSSPYQAMLTVKIVLVGLMVGLAIFNRYGLVPRIAGQRRGAVKAIRIGAILEIALGLAVIGLVSTFGTLAPTSDS
jgi:copper resistance protein D